MTEPDVHVALPKAVFRMVLAVNRRLAREPDPQRAMRFLLETAISLSGARAGALVVDSGEGPRVEVHTDLDGGERRAVARTLVADAIAAGRTLTSHEALQEPELARAPSVRDLRQAAAICVPFTCASGARGALYVERTGRATPFGAEDRRHLGLLAEQAGLGVDRLLERDAGAPDAAEPTAPAAPRRAAPPELLGRSSVMEELRATIERLAATDLPVLLLGETGTGKELVARALHAASARRRGPYVAESCAAIPSELAESELFGHGAGAFTGAAGDRRGLLEEASGGTLFLDEVLDMPAAVQAKLLRALQEQRIRPLGREDAVAVDVRVLAACTRDPRTAVRAGRFREDLYYRLAGAVLEVPPLRARGDDVLLLADAFLDELRAVHGRAVRLDDAGRARLRGYGWPGNVRELRHVLARAFVLAERDVIAEHLLPDGGGAGVEPEAAAPTTLAEAEKVAVRDALRACGGDKSRAARALGISRSALYAKIRRHGV